jgi:hypothetical protein
MRFRHIWSETRAGLRQNLTMTLAVIVTMWVSLSLFGAGLLASQQVNLMKGRWYDKIEISIFLCAKDTRGDQCDPGQDVTPGQKDEIRRTLETNPEVAPDGIYFETKQEAYAEFQRAYEGSPIQDSLTVDQMQESFRVKLRNPEEYQGVVSSVVGLKGVQKVQDLHQLLDPFFRALNVLQWSTAGASALLLLATPDRQHHSFGDLRTTPRDWHYASGWREQLLHHDAVLARRSDLGIDRCSSGVRDHGGGGVFLDHPRGPQFGPVYRLDRLAANRPGDGWRRRGRRRARGDPNSRDDQAIPQGLIGCALLARTSDLVVPG